VTKSILTLAALALTPWATSPAAFAGENHPAIDVAMKDAITAMKTVYEGTYAPTKWKQDHFGWSLDAEYNRALSDIQSRASVPGTPMTAQDARDIVKNFIYSTKDYHVSVTFQSTEVSELPFTVRSAEGRYFIVYINKARLGETVFPFNVGDELVTFDGLPAADAVAKVIAEVTPNITETDRALAELSLTRRRGTKGYHVPKGPIMVGIKKKGETAVTERQLIWEHAPERVAPYRPVAGATKAAPNAFDRLLKKQMSFDFEGVAADENPHGLGTKKSYLPALGKKIWEASSEHFDAYIAMSDTRKMIGVIRIPSYVPSDTEKALKSFAEIVKHMEEMTDGLVIDQLNNPGGSVFYLYSLVSMLSDHPMKNPLHRMSITPADVMDAVSVLDELRAVKDDATAREVIGDSFDGYPVDYQFAQFFKAYANTIVQDWDGGRTMSRPYWIAGVDKINPNPVHYTKPILIVTNELDFSGGDFFPTIMQDNARAKVLGTRTAGAGGYVSDFTIPNLVGIAGFRVTQSIAERVSGNPIENLGVTPDFPVAMKAEDLENGYKPFAKSVLDTMLSMIP